MLQKTRERLTLLLIALLPLHAFLVTVLTKLIAGKGHAPLPWIAVWKEGVLAVILLLIIFETISSGKKFLRFDLLDWLIAALLVLGVAVTAFTHADWKLALLGFRYDFVPLVAFLVARRIEWSAWFRERALMVLLGVGVLIAAYGILTVFLPIPFFRWLGYAPAHSLYFASGPVAAFQQVSETALRRVQSTMSGPNQFGLWLLIPLSVLLARPRRGAVFIGSLVTILLALFLTFSRAAWIGAFVMSMVVLLRSVPRRYLKRASIGAIGIVATIGIVASVLFPSVFFRLSSSRGHLVRPLQAVARMWDHPLGEGLGAAGPASNRVSETCVFLRPQDDPSWAKTTPTLCVFLGTTQVQPADHVCRCPFLPENWYLQIGVEMGVLGFLLFIALVVLVLRRLGFRELGNSGTREIQQVAFLAFLGIAVASLFLHAWEDSATAYTLWLLAAVLLPLSRRA